MFKWTRVVIAVLYCAVLFDSGCAVNKTTSSSASQSGITVDKLRCEYRVDPLGIDVLRPRLSWIVKSDQRSQRQNAYRILVADNEPDLLAGKGNLWDSGKVESDETISIFYSGKALTSHISCYWKVMAWDKANVASSWSEPAMWSMGLLDADEFQARWIGYDTRQSEVFMSNKTPSDNVLDGCSWVWFPESNPQISAPVGTRYFRRTFEIPNHLEMKQARLLLTADDNTLIYINGKKFAKFKNWFSVRTFDVTDELATGINALAIAVKNVGIYDNPAGLIGKLFVEFKNSESLTLKIDETWKVSKAEQCDWTTLNFDDSGWTNARKFADLGDEPWGDMKQGSLVLNPPAYLRKEFLLDKPVKRAFIYASALGLYEVHINGQKAGQDYLTPGWTDYNKRVYYNTYNVTSLLRKGKNAIGAVLADGWYSGYVGMGRRRNHYGKVNRFFGQLHVEYDDGTTAIIITDPSWKASTGPLLEADLLMGETYDARRQITGWSEIGFDQNAWKKVSVLNGMKAKVGAYPGVTVQKFTEIKPLKMTEPKEGVYVFDMGQNFAGQVRLTINGNVGDKVVLRYAERLNPDGTIYTQNLRGARATDTYICQGGGEEIWQPRFTFHGFQYVEVRGYPGKPSEDAISGIELTSAAPVTSRFECSDETANKLYRNICQTQRSNFIDVPTDCPQRDERLGWTGDAQVYVPTACINADTQAFFTKWLVDLTDAQRADGQFPMVAPLLVAGGDGGPAWADAGIICPWTLYQVYGDKQILQEHYSAMERFIEFNVNRSTKELLPPARFHCFGDWLNIDADTPREVIYTAYFAYSTQLMGRIASALNKQDDALKYNRLFERIKISFNETYVAEDGRIKGDTQCGYVLAIAFDLLEPNMRKLAAKHLVDDIKRRNWHLSTGFVGTKDLMLALAKIGRNDVAYRLFHNDTFPSWGFSIKHGATSIWERWNGWTPDKGFYDPDMNSFAHYSFGAVGQWMFENIAGINTDTPGFEHIIIKPQPGGRLTFAKSGFESIRGSIATDWQIRNDQLILNVTIPANTTATVYIPAQNANEVTESNMPADKAEGVKFLRMEADAVVYEVGSGTYSFASGKKRTENR